MEASTAERLAQAMHARQFDRLADMVAPDCVLRSPITDSFEFQGREAVMELLPIVRDAYEELDYTDVFASSGLGVQVFRARVAGRWIEGLDLIRLDADGRVREFTVFFRPLPGLALLTRALAARVGRRLGSPWGRVVGALVAPLVLLTRVGDRLGVWLLTRAFRRR